jgi:hypothetical protein
LSMKLFYYCLVDRISYVVVEDFNVVDRTLLLSIGRLLGLDSPYTTYRSNGIPEFPRLDLAQNIKECSFTRVGQHEYVGESV